MELALGVEGIGAGLVYAAVIAPAVLEGRSGSGSDFGPGKGRTGSGRGRCAAKDGAAGKAGEQDERREKGSRSFQEILQIIRTIAIPLFRRSSADRLSTGPTLRQRMRMPNFLGKPRIKEHKRLANMSHSHKKNKGLPKGKRLKTIYPFDFRLSPRPSLPAPHPEPDEGPGAGETESGVRIDGEADIRSLVDHEPQLLG
jgi:hypothetical protein